tara:strand:- start:332 stop:652 length:321 start_codon:yes stop_codon:yes gene_type:complete
MAKEATATSTIAASKEVSIDDLASQLATLKNDIAELTGAMTNFSKTRGRAAADQAKTTAQGLADTGRVKAAEAQESAEEFIRTQPATALGIAAGIGFLVGLVAARR